MLPNFIFIYYSSHLIISQFCNKLSHFCNKLSWGDATMLQRPKMILFNNNKIQKWEKVGVVKKRYWCVYNNPHFLLWTMILSLILLGLHWLYHLSHKLKDPSTQKSAQCLLSDDWAMLCLTHQSNLYRRRSEVKKPTPNQLQWDHSVKIYPWNH